MRRARGSRPRLEPRGPAAKPGAGSPAGRPGVRRRRAVGEAAVDIASTSLPPDTGGTHGRPAPSKFLKTFRTKFRSFLS